jgi:hypothetical protein
MGAGKWLLGGLCVVVLSGLALAGEVAVFGPPVRLEGEELDMTLDYDGVGVAVADWDKDGKKDVIGGTWNGTVYWYRNIGTDADPKFDFGELLQVRGFPQFWNIDPRPALTDWNNDGKLDLVLGMGKNRYAGKDVPLGDEICLFLRGADGKLPAEPTLIRTKDGKHLLAEALGSAKDWRPAPCVVDWNADGKKDLVVGCGPGNVYVFLNVGTDDKPEFDGTFTKIDVKGAATVPSVGDLNGDKKKDLVVGLKDGKLLVFINTGLDAEPKFGEPKVLWETPKRPTYPLPAVPCVVDWDGDGKNEILVGTEQKLTLLKLAPDGLSVAGTSLVGGKGLAYYGGFAINLPPFTADLDGDGLLDLFIIGDSEAPVNQLFFFRNCGTKEKPQFKTGTVLTRLPVGTRCARYNLFDWNADGKLDLVISTKGGDFFVSLNQGTATEPKLPFISPDGANAPAGAIRVTGADGKPLVSQFHRWFVDWDSDGLVDILVAAHANAGGQGQNIHHGEVYWYKNVGTKAEPKFAEEQLIRVGDKPIGSEGVWPCDIDGDGDMDLLLTINKVDPVTKKPGFEVLLNDAGPGKTPVLKSAGFLKDDKGELITPIGYKKVAKYGTYYAGTTDLNGDGVLDLLQVDEMSCHDIWIRYGVKK